MEIKKLRIVDFVLFGGIYKKWKNDEEATNSIC
jgi:hypothetical protein